MHNRRKAASPPSSAVVVVPPPPYVSLLVLFCLCLNISTTSGADADVLLEIARLEIPGSNQLSSWNANNISNICLWERVECDGNGFVNQLLLNAEYLYPFLRGSIPASLVNLTQLAVITLEHNELVGDLPVEFWSLPNLRFAFVSNTGINVRFPPRLTSSLRMLGFGRTSFNGTVPDMDWNRLVAIDGTASGVYCPLPQGLVDKLNNLTDPLSFRCRFGLTPLEIDAQNRVCGQIHVSKFTCHSVPFVNRPSPPTTARFSFDYGNLTLEFEKDNVYIYKAYLDGGVRKVYRTEYASFQFFPLSQFVDLITSSYTVLGSLVELETVFWNSSTVLVAKARQSILNGTIHAEYIFNFAPPPRSQSDQPFVKLSVRYINDGVQWLPSNLTASVIVPITVYFRSPHSPYGGPALTCDFSNGQNFQSCTSSRSQLDIRVFVLAVPPYSQIIYKTEHLLFDYSYSITGAADGVPLNAFGDGVSATIVKFFSPLGSIENIGFHQVANATNLLRQRVEQESMQYVAFTGSLGVPTFQRELLYDPDFAMDLLFDPSVNQRAAPIVTADLDQATLSTVAIVLIVIVIVVAIAIVVLLPTVIFPYLKRRGQTTANELEDTHPSPEHQRLKETTEPAATSWRGASPSQSL